MWAFFGAGQDSAAPLAVPAFAREIRLAKPLGFRGSAQRSGGPVDPARGLSSLVRLALVGDVPQDFLALAGDRAAFSSNRSIRLRFHLREARPPNGGEIARAHDDRDVVHAAPDERPAIDIHRL